MHKIVVTIFLLINTSYVFANITGINDNRFQSNLKINQPKTIISTYDGSRRERRLHPYNCPRCHHNNPYLSSSDLNALEKYALNKTYRRENDLKRLERLENLAFGSTQSGDIFSRYQNVENAILSRPKYTEKKSIIGNLANYFAGQATGFTPSLMPYENYNNLGGFSTNPYLFTPNIGPNYMNNQFENYSNGIFSGGWGYRGNDYGTGSSIKILD